MKNIKEELQQLVEDIEAKQKENSEITVKYNDENFQDLGAAITVKNMLLDGIKKII